MPKSSIKAIDQIAYHRNGISGAPFHAVLFAALNDEGKRESYLASVFEEPGCVSVISIDRLAQSGVAFGDNSWRGDHYEPELRTAIAAFERTR